MEVNEDSPSALRSILRELPRRKVALVLTLVVVNLVVVTYLRGQAIAIARLKSPGLPRGVVVHNTANSEYVVVGETSVPPWKWTADEWRETVWPWK